MGMRMPYIEEVHHRTGSNVLVVSYRGYGLSGGETDEGGMKEDALTIVDYAMSRNEIDKRRVFLLGVSFGGAVAINTAVYTRHKLAGVIVDNTFTSLDDLIDAKITPCLRKLLFRNHWRSIDIIRKVTVPMLFFTGLQDKMIPPEHSLRLYEMAVNCEFKEKHDFQEGVHKDLFLTDIEKYFSDFNDFINKAIRP